MVLRAPEMALRVLGVMVGPEDELVLLLLLLLLPMIERKAAVPGDGGKPPTRGVRPVPGVRPVRGVRPVLGVRPVRKLLGSKGRWDCSVVGWGPASMAGESGPARREFAREVENCQL